jgi:predicted nuclease of restriction endonuclease-like (RecB) superfamily
MDIDVRKQTKQTVLFSEIRELILAARNTVARSIDTIQVVTCFEIGRRIVEHEQHGSERAAYGKETLKELSEKLGSEFGKGFSLSNLKLMRQFYLLKKFQIGQTVSDQLLHSEKSQIVSGHSPASANAGAPQVLLPKLTLSWSHYVFLIGIKNDDERCFYEIEATQQDWSLRELKRQFNTGLYERLALSRDKEGVIKLAQEGQVVAKPEDLLKNPYVLEFLGLDEKAKYSESDLEAAIIDKIEHFLLELGKGFFSRRGRSALPLTRIIFLSIWSFTTVCCAAMS